MTRWIVGIALLLVTGCSTSGGEGDCGAIVPASCPTTTPSYQTDVAPILKTYCVSCHVDGGREADKPLDTYSRVIALSHDTQDEIAGCDMPPSDEAQPTAAQRNTVLAWLVCGAPNN